MLRQSRVRPRKLRMNRATLALVFFAAALPTGCWTPPTADRRPSGPPRIIDQGIIVEGALPPAIVQSVDRATRTVVTRYPNAPESRAYHVGSTASALTHLFAGDKICARASAALTVYASPDGRLPNANRSTTDAALGARVLSIDPSYRLLTLRYADGNSGTFKMALKIRLAQMQPGDDVLIQPLELVALSPCAH